MQGFDLTTLDADLRLQAEAIPPGGSADLRLAHLRMQQAERNRLRIEWPLEAFDADLRKPLEIRMGQGGRALFDEWNACTKLQEERNTLKANAPLDALDPVLQSYVNGFAQRPSLFNQAWREAALLQEQLTDLGRRMPLTSLDNDLQKRVGAADKPRERISAWESAIRQQEQRGRVANLDDDLRQQLTLFSEWDQVRELSKLETLQEQRKARKIRLSQMTAIERKREILREKVVQLAECKSAQKADPFEVAFIYSVFAICGLPYKKPPAALTRYTRTYGAYTLQVKAGELQNPESGNPETQGLPWGPVARRLLAYICTEAMLQNSREVKLPETITEFVRDLGYSDNAGPRGQLAAVKDQLNRIAAADFRIFVKKEQGATTIKVDPIKVFDVYMTNERGKSQWSARIMLDGDFFNLLKRHAVPFNLEALKVMGSSAILIDILWWLQIRLNNLPSTRLFKWNDLQNQFAPDNTTNHYKFRADFKKHILALLKIDPLLPVQVLKDGLLLTPGKPSYLIVPRSERKQLGKL